MARKAEPKKFDNAKVTYADNGHIEKAVVRVSYGYKENGKPNTISKTFKPSPDAKTKRDKENELTAFIASMKSAAQAGTLLSKKQEMAKAEEEKKAIEAEARKNPLVIDFINNEFLPKKKKEVCGSTYNAYTDALLEHFKSFHQRRIRDITRRELQNFFNKWVSEAELKRSSISVFKGKIGKMFEYAYDTELIEVNPMIGVKLPEQSKEDKEKKEAKRMTPKQVEEFKEYLMFVQDNPQLEALYLFMLDSGVRVGEAIALKWDNVKFETDTNNHTICYVTISESMNMNDDCTYSIGKPKTGNIRTIPLTDFGTEIMFQWNVECAIRDCYEEIVFPASKTQSGYMTHKYVYNNLKKIGEKLNIPDLHPHTLRHTMASIWLSKGIPYQTVSQRLGHSSPKTTMETYSHCSDEDSLNAVQIMNQILQNQTETNSPEIMA